MANNAFLTVAGLKGSARQTHVKDKSVVNGFEHTIESNRDAETGQPKGKPRHRGMVVTKEIDLASPGLHKGHADGTEYSSVSVEFWRMPPAGGQEENYYSIVLSKAKVASIRTVMLHNRLEGNALIAEYEEVSFTYESINWKFKTKDGGADSQSETQCNPAPDKLEEMAKTTLMDAATALGEKLKEGAKAMVTEGATPPAQ